MTRGRNRATNNNKRINNSKTTLAQVPCKIHGGGQSKDSNDTQPRDVLGPNFIITEHLPQEICDRVLEFLLLNKHPIPVNASRFTKISMAACPEPIDTKLLSTTWRLKRYYTLNTFSISLDDFYDFPEIFEKWNQQIAARYVHRVHVRVRKHHNWIDAIKCLRMFKELDEITFDVRWLDRIDWTVTGDLRGWSTFSRVPASEKVKEIMKEGGIDLEHVKICIGVDSSHQDRFKAARKHEDNISGALKRGVQKQLEGPKPPRLSHTIPIFTGDDDE